MTRVGRLGGDWPPKLFRRLYLDSGNTVVCFRPTGFVVAADNWLELHDHPDFRTQYGGPMGGLPQHWYDPS